MKKTNYIKNAIDTKATKNNITPTTSTKNILAFNNILKMNEKKQALYICDIINNLKLDDLKNALNINNKLFFEIAKTIQEMKEINYNKYVNNDIILKYSNYIINQLNNSNLTAKLKNINAISTLFLCNYRCLRRINSIDCNSICKHCFAQKINIQACLSYLKNTLILCFFKLNFKNLYIASKNINNMIRFEAFGDIININQFLNYYNIAKNNKKYNFALWTKNHDIVNNSNLIKLKNLNVIYSYSTICTKENINLMGSLHVDILKKFDGYDKKFIVCKNDESIELLKNKCINNNINYNICNARSCATCKHCYTNKNNTIVIEKLK